MQVRNLSSHTQATYVQQVFLFARHFNKSPEILGPEEIRSYQIYLMNERKLAPSSIIIAVAALRFLYKITLHKNWNFEEVNLKTEMAFGFRACLGTGWRVSVLGESFSGICSS